jgi:K+-transporting ATPase KdpF subunit
VALREARPVSLDLLAGLGAALAFAYLLWALLRPEDF